MRNVWFVLAALALVAVACGGGPAPTPVTVYVPVTVTPKPQTLGGVPVAPRPEGRDYPGSVVDGHVRGLVLSGWYVVLPNACDGTDCVALENGRCSYMMLYFNPKTGVEDGFTFMSDFNMRNESCPSGEGMAQDQMDALDILEAWDAELWLGKMSSDDGLPAEPGDPPVGGTCGAWTCVFELDDDVMGVLNVYYR